MSLEEQLTTKQAKLQKVNDYVTLWRKAYEELNLMTTDLISQVKSLQKELKYITEKALGKGIYIGFKGFCHLWLLLQLDFKIKALKALVTSEAI